MTIPTSLCISGTVTDEVLTESPAIDGNEEHGFATL